MNLDLQGKNALVCGGSKGIGKAIALELAILGANVTLCSRSEDILQSAALELDTSNGNTHDYFTADFSKPDLLKNALNNYLAKTGKAFNILINNTGGPAGGPIVNAETSEFLSAFNNHLICNHILATTLIPAFKETGYGRIVNIISTSVKVPLNGLGVSNTIRGAVASWSKTLANELGQFGITVNNVLPGATNTDRLKSIIENKAAKTNKEQAEVSKAMQGVIPMARFGEPNEIANVAAFLCSPAAAYVSGQSIAVDGGRTPSL
ncbi:MAG: SDR family oxidoreductase [Chitinophagales bacterium]